jgi:ABC-2 type transport system permease protein
MRTLHAEWTKLRTDRGTAWLLLGVVVATVGIGVVTADSLACATAGCPLDAPRVSLTGVLLGQAVVAILGVSIIGNEYGTGLIAPTLTATPRRLALLATKAALLVGVVGAAGALAVVGSLVAGRVILPDYPALSGGEVRAGVGSVLYLVLVALLSLGIATAVRNSAVAIGAVLGLLYLFPIIAEAVGDPDWQRHLRQAGPMTAGLLIQSTRDLDDLPLSPWTGLAVLAAWSTAALLAGALLLHHRDA